MNSFLWKAGAISAASSVIIQAIGGHKPWDVDRKLIFNKMFQMHITAAIGMMLCSMRMSQYSYIPGLLLLGGTFLFSVVGYYRCFKDDKKYNYLMPSGGSGIILGLLLMAMV